MVKKSLSTIAKSQKLYCIIYFLKKYDENLSQNTQSVYQNTCMFEHSYSRLLLNMCNYVNS